MADRIEKKITLDAPVGRVWQALTDHREFGDWFGVTLEGPFEAGKTSRGKITHPGYEHLKWEANIEAMETDRRFAMTWHPHAVDPEKDYSGESPRRGSSSPSNRKAPARGCASPRTGSTRCRRTAARKPIG